MFTSLPSSHGNTDSKDQDVDDKTDDMSVAANLKRRFVVPTGTLLRIRDSMDSVGVSPWDFTLDDPSNAAALASDHFHLESKSFDDDDTKSTGVCKEDGEEVTQPSQDDLSTSTLPIMLFKVSCLTYDCSSSYTVQWDIFPRYKFSQISQMGTLLGKIYSWLLHEVQLWVAIA